jgi:hypothetical protein
MRSPAFVLALALAGCATMPGSTITVLAYNPSQVVLEYTRWYDGEFQSAMLTAQNYCQQFRKNAQAGATTPAGPNPVDRVVTTFNCV